MTLSVILGKASLQKFLWLLWLGHGRHCIGWIYFFLWNKALIGCLKMSSPQLINTAFDRTFLSLHKSPMVVFVLRYTVFMCLLSTSLRSRIYVYFFRFWLKLLILFSWLWFETHFRLESAQVIFLFIYLFYFKWLFHLYRLGTRAFTFSEKDVFMFTLEIIKHPLPLHCHVVVLMTVLQGLWSDQVGWEAMPYNLEGLLD